jgi:hypothetical protein
VTSFAFRGI